MNDWDKVEKRRRQATEQDIFFEYLKTACFLIAGYLVSKHPINKSDLEAIKNV